VGSPYFIDYIELNWGQGIQAIAIYEDTPYVNVWIDSELADDINNKMDLMTEYGDIFYKTLEDYKSGNSLTIDDVWPNDVV